MPGHARILTSWVSCTLHAALQLAQNSILNMPDPTVSEGLHHMQVSAKQAGATVNQCAVTLDPDLATA